MEEKDKKNLKRRHSNSNKDEGDLQTDTEMAVKRISIELKETQPKETEETIDDTLNTETLNALKLILRKELSAVLGEFELTKEQSSKLTIQNIIDRTNLEQLISEEENIPHKISNVTEELEDYDETDDISTEALEDSTEVYLDDSEGDSYSDYEYETEEEHQTQNITKTREESDDPYF